MTPCELVLIADRGHERFEIVKDPAVGFYVWRFDVPAGISTHDHLQDDLDRAKQCALDEFGVALDAWRVPGPADVVIRRGQVPAGWGAASGSARRAGEMRAESSV